MPSDETPISQVRWLIKPHEGETWRFFKRCMQNWNLCTLYIRPHTSITPSSKCALAFSSTYQMTSPRTKVPPYRADIVHGISGDADIEYVDGDILPALPETNTIESPALLSYDP